MYAVDGTGTKQAPCIHVEHGVKAPASPTHPTAARGLLSDRQAAEFLGIGERTFLGILSTADWLPAPIVLGPRLRRWDAAELLTAVRTRAPRGNRPAEPEQLRRARIERQRSTGVPA